MTISKRTVLLSLMLVVAGSGFAHAQSGASRRRNVPVLITSTLSNRANDTLTIRGEGFGRRPEQVWCEDHPLTIVSWTDAEIVVYLPEAMPDGSYLLTVIRGDGEDKQDSFDMAVQGQGAGGTTGGSGPKGDKGDPGPAGATGAVGPKGEQGPAGPKGDAGPASAKGDTGAVGPKGDAGVAGPKGDVGAAGAKGDIGVAGPKGEQGLMGPKGEAGAKGETGAAGSQGPTGVAGLQGEPGPAGPQGPQGSQGQAGFQGPMGPMGPAGAQGANGVSGYEIVSTPVTSVTINGNQTTSLNAVCPEGKNAIGGGFDYSGNAAPLSTVASFPVAADTWRVMVRLSQVPAATFQGRAFVVCAAR